MPSSHTLHEQCITELRRKRASSCCPLCREHSDDLTPVQVLIDKALVHIIQKSYVQGLNELSEAIDVDPANPRANQLIGECYDKGYGVPSDFERAEVYYQEAHRGDNFQATYNLGVLFEQRGDTTKAHWLDGAYSSEAIQHPYDQESDQESDQD